MRGTSRRPTGEYVIFQAVTPELAEEYAKDHDLVIIKDPEQPTIFSRGNYKDMLYAWSFYAGDSTRYFAERLHPIDTSKGDKL